MSNYILTVDPGVYTMGACLWKEEEWFSDFTCFPFASMSHEYTPKERKALAPMAAMQQLIEHLENWFNVYSITECHCEKPQVFNSGTGYAANMKGHIGHMEMFRGMLYKLCANFDCVFFDVLVTDWKGQLPKDLVIDRIKELFWLEGNRAAFTVLKDHAFDAAGIGFHLQGVFV